MRRIATAHLLHGYIGAGKTTLAKRLEARHAAVRFTPDAWMSALIGSDPPAAAFAGYDHAIKEQLRPIWVRLLGLGVDVVLDYGFWSRAEREAARREVRAAGGVPRLYEVTIDEATARRRIATRNLADPAGLQISPEAYDALHVRFEPLLADEPARRQG